MSDPVTAVAGLAIEVLKQIPDPTMEQRVARVEGRMVGNVRRLEWLLARAKARRRHRTVWRRGTRLEVAKTRLNRFRSELARRR